MRILYPEIEANFSDYLKTDDGHEVYYEEAGNPKGKPVLFIHGGPGGGCDAKHRRYFDPDLYRIILVDQRGAGRSKPHASLENNTTWTLIDDFETIRKKLNINKWMLFGGSWGSTLSLIYSITHPEVVTEMVLRGIFLCRPSDLHWFYQQGASEVFPDAWQQYIKPIPENQRHDFITAFHKQLTSSDKTIQKEASYAWSTWEGACYRLIPDNDDLARFASSDFALALARIECHYFINNCFLSSSNWILENADKIQHIPTTITHGRFDMICPMRQAWDLHKKLPLSQIKIIPNAAHAAAEPGIIDHLISSTDRFAH